jgi:5-(carboxyamino)imidazole ribonucleotide mutase
MLSKRRSTFVDHRRFTAPRGAQNAGCGTGSLNGGMTAAGKLAFRAPCAGTALRLCPKLRRIEGLGRHLSVVETPVAIIMGSESDFETMRHAATLLDTLKIGFVARIVSAHRTPERLVSFAKGARAAGFKVIIAGAGGAAHLPGMTAALTALPVLGVPIETTALGGQDSLFSIVQMPAGVPVGTLAIGKPGAINAALLAAAILALADPAIEARLSAWRAAQTAAVAERPSREA